MRKIGLFEQYLKVAPDCTFLPIAYHCPVGSRDQLHQGSDFGFTQEWSPPWPSDLQRRNPTPAPMVRARFEPRCRRPHFAPTHNGVRVSVAGTAQRPESVSGRRGPCPAYRARLTFELNSAIALELCDRVVASFPWDHLRPRLSQWVTDHKSVIMARPLEIIQYT